MEPEAANSCKKNSPSEMHSCFIILCWHADVTVLSRAIVAQYPRDDGLDRYEGQALGNKVRRWRDPPVMEHR